MKVYLAQHNWAWEGSWTIGIYSSLEEAKKACQESDDNPRPSVPLKWEAFAFERPKWDAEIDDVCSFSIEEWEVQS